MRRLSKQIQPALAAFILLATVLLGGRAEAAIAYTVGLSATTPNIGKVSSGSATTNFVVDAATGSVAAGAGGGQFIPYNATRTALTTITIGCSGGTACANTVVVTISAGSATGRAGAITGFTADFSGTSTARLSSGAASASGGSTLSMTLSGIGNSASKTFTLGMTIPILTTGAAGNATAAYTVTAGSAAGSAAAQAKVEGALSLSKQSDLSFGRVVLLTGQSGTATWAAATQAWTLTGAIAMTTHTIGQFTVTGTPTQAINFTIPSTISLTNGLGGALPVTVSTTGQGTQLINSAGNFVFYVGGQISFTSSTPTGAYTANFPVGVNYQ
ncbi:MAG: hypothetical protein JWP50_1703 [Phenylobacterium sp.]|nr:hypothetical protein [Phenylobacterium sp.]